MNKNDFGDYTYIVLTKKLTKTDIGKLLVLCHNKNYEIYNLNLKSKYCYVISYDLALRFDFEMPITNGADLCVNNISDFINELNKLKAIHDSKVFTLNNQYCAIIRNNTVKVGCQEFTHEIILSLADKIKKYNSNKK